MGVNLVEKYLMKLVCQASRPRSRPMPPVDTRIVYCDKSHWIERYQEHTLRPGIVQPNANPANLRFIRVNCETTVSVIDGEH